MAGVELDLDKLGGQSRDGIVLAIEGRIVHANRFLEALLGYEAGELAGQPLARLSGADPARQDGARYQALFRRKDACAVTVEIIRIACAWQGTPASLLMVREVEDLLRGEHGLHRRQLRQIIDLLPEAIFVKDGDGRFVLANKTTAEFFGTTVEQLIGKRHSDFHLERDQNERFRSSDRAALGARAPSVSAEEEVADATGQRHILQAVKVPFIVAENEPPAVLAVVANLTERKRTENALALSEQRLRSSLTYANLGNWDWDIGSGEVYWSEWVAPLFGYTAGERITTYRDFLAAVHPDDRQAVDEAVRTAIASGSDYSIAHRVVWPDGSIHWLHEAGGVLYDDHGQAVRMMGVVRDITASKLTEQALMESERKYRALMENASDAILLATPTGWLVDANRRAEELLGYSREELLSRHVTAIHPKEDHPVLSAAFRDLNTKGSSLYEHLILHKDGTVSNVEVAATTIEHQGQNILMGIFRDITARKRLEQERLDQSKSQRDTLVREVHHRIKNNLQGVVGLLRQHITRHAALRAPLEAAIHQVNAMAVVHGLFGQNSSESIILCEMVTAICQAARGMTGKAIEPCVEVQVRSPHQVTRDEAVPLALILNELVFNAVKHQALTVQSIRVNVHDLPQGAQVNIITPDTRLPPGFDFTAGRGLGTGLNLIKSLLPPSGCQLSLRDSPEGVVTVLELAPPVILPQQQPVQTPPLAEPA